MKYKGYEEAGLCERLTVICPKLVCLEYGGHIAKHFSFDVRSLNKAVIELEYIEKSEMDCSFGVTIYDLFAQVSHVEYLSINYYFVQSISFKCECCDCPEEGFPECLPNLKTLEITSDCYIMHVFIRILECSPNLESLNLIIHEDIFPEEFEAFIRELDEVETRRKLTHYLKRVEFVEFYGEKETLDIARFLLEHGNALEEMVFSWSNKDKYRKKSMEAMNEVTKFYKSSLSVKVITILEDQ